MGVVFRNVPLRILPPSLVRKSNQLNLRADLVCSVLGLFVVVVIHGDSNVLIDPVGLADRGWFGSFRPDRLLVVVLIGSQLFGEFFFGNF